MGYQDVKAVAKDMAKLALNGSPYWRMGVTLSVLILGSLMSWGFSFYATAEDVDRKIKAAIDPVQKQVADLTDDTKEIVVELLESKIREAVHVRCESPSGSRDRENREIDKLQRQYHKREGRFYDVPECDEL